MKRFLISVLFLASLVGLRGAEERYLRQTILDSVPLPTTVNRVYRLLLPEKMEQGSEAKFPLIVYLHGGNSRGDDGSKPIAEYLPKRLAEPEMRSAFPCFVLVPQCKEGVYPDGRPYNWAKWEHQKGAPTHWLKSEDEASDQLRAAMAALKDVMDRHPIDPSRVYLIGVSMGGSGAWSWAARQPDRFAALLAVCGLSETSRAESLSKTPIWVFQGGKDEVIPVQRTREMVQALDAVRGNVKYTEYSGEGHRIDHQVFSGNDDATLKWLFEQRLNAP